MIKWLFKQRSFVIAYLWMAIISMHPAVQETSFLMAGVISFIFAVIFYLALNMVWAMMDFVIDNMMKGFDSVWAKLTARRSQYVPVSSQDVSGPTQTDSDTLN